MNLATPIPLGYFAYSPHIPYLWKYPCSLFSLSLQDHEAQIIRCEDINKIPGLENVAYPSATYAAKIFGEYNLWAPPSNAELHFWENLKMVRKKLAHVRKLRELHDSARVVISPEDILMEEPEEKVDVVAEPGAKSLGQPQPEETTEVSSVKAPIGQEFKRLVLQRTEKEKMPSYTKVARAQHSVSANRIQTSEGKCPANSNSTAIKISKSSENCSYPPGSRLCTYLNKSPETVMSEDDDDNDNENEDSTVRRIYESTFSGYTASGLRYLDDEISQDDEVQELLQDERQASKSEKRRDKDSKKERPIIEIREGESMYGSNGEKREFLCVFCKGNNETEDVYKSHPIRVNGDVLCPFLRNHVCAICKETGHTIKYCKINKRGFFAMKSIGKADIFLTSEKAKLAEATTSALVEATNSGLIPQSEEDNDKKNEIQSQSKRKISRLPLAPVSNQVVNRGHSKDSVESEYTPIGRYDVKKIPITSLQNLTSNARVQRVRKTSK